MGVLVKIPAVYGEPFHLIKGKNNMCYKKDINKDTKNKKIHAFLKFLWQD